jgi:hypothetical protein
MDGDPFIGSFVIKFLELQIYRVPLTDKFYIPLY